MKQFSADGKVAILRWAAAGLAALGILDLVYAIGSRGAADSLIIQCSIAVIAFGLPALVVSAIAYRIERNAAEPETDRDMEAS